MDDEIRKAIDEIEFEPKKCEEIINTFADTLIENNCSEVEIDYILSVLNKLFNEEAIKIRYLQ